MSVLVIPIYTLPFQTLFHPYSSVPPLRENMSVCFSKGFIQKEENVANVVCVNTIDKERTTLQCEKILLQLSLI